MLSSSKLKPPRLRGFLRTIYVVRKRATYPATESGMRITFGFTEWGEYDHLCKKAPNKSRKSVKKLEIKYCGTDNYVIDGINS